MRLYFSWLPLALLAILCTVDARRVKVQPTEDDYYDDQAQPQVVLVSQDEYNGIYRQQAAARQDNYVPRTRIDTNLRGSRTKQEKPPPVQTIRNYNKVNDDGSFTFGYEAADGSFKEETRGTDCVVRGKYGYIDPDGNKREFTYVSGNPCDPNAKEEESQEKEDDRAEADAGPANYPSVRPVRPIIRPTQSPKPAVTVFQNIFEMPAHDEVEQPEPEQVLRPTLPPVRHRLVPARPTYIPEERPSPVLIQSRPRYHTTTPTTYTEEVRPVTVTPRPTLRPVSTKIDQATTYRPLLQVAVTPRPALLYTPKSTSTPFRSTHFPSSTPASVTTSPIDFAAEFQKFTSDNHLHSSTPSPVRTTKPGTLHTNVQQSTSNPIYSSELIFDPNSGQYNTAVYQTLPQTEGDFTLRHRIQPYVHQPQPQLVSLSQLQKQSPLYRPTSNIPSQSAYQQTQQEIQFLNSQQLFAQQQKARQQQQQHQATKTEPQQFYYIQPSLLNSQPGLAGGQIDAFLRGHNIQF